MTFRHRTLNLLGWGLLSALFLSVSYLSSCAYQVVGLPVHHQGVRQNVSVEPFTNLTRVPMLDVRTAQALRQSILASQTLNLVQALQAQQYIEGTIQEFRQIPISFDRRDNAQQYRLEADILIRLVETASRSLFFEQKLTVWAEYLVSPSGDVRETTIARESAMFRLAQQFANQSVGLLTAAMN